jgi:hypothetical protein
VSVSFRIPAAEGVVATKLVDGMARLLAEYSYSAEGEQFGKGHR